MQLLTEVRASTLCRIKWMLGLPDETEEELNHAQIQQGSEICVIQNNGCGMIIGSGTHRIAMGAETAQKIRV
ncbi:MAG: FeoA domain-containing protein [Lachnospiraceae bacterium]|nr:FeoA domain-containing protein [Lachnospiraceae bacterium]